MNIIPMRDLKDTVRIENLCYETKAPIFVTKNGYGKLVVMDIETFENLLNRAYEAKMLNEGLNDLKKGNIEKGDQVLEELKTKYGL